MATAAAAAVAHVTLVHGAGHPVQTFTLAQRQRYIAQAVPAELEEKLLVWLLGRKLWLPVAALLEKRRQESQL